MLVRADLIDEQLGSLAQLPVLPRELFLDTAKQADSVSLLRRVWGMALAQLDPAAWDVVSEGRGGGTRFFVLADAFPETATGPLRLRWTVIGEGIQYDVALLKAWDEAAASGLGASRVRFHIVRTVNLGPDGTPRARHDNAPWTLAQARWPLGNSPENTPCRLCFFTPVYLERQNVPISTPTLTNIVAFARHRVSSYLPEEARAVFAWDGLGQTLEQIAASTPAVQASSWVTPEVVKRNSARQGREVWLKGVCGAIDLPKGPGPIWPLLLAASWLHLGKHTTEGLGRITIEAVR